MSEYKGCKITHHKNGTFSVLKSNLCDTALGIQLVNSKMTLDEVRKHIDETEARALAVFEEGKKTAEQIMQAHKEIETFNALSEQNGRKAIQSAISAGTLLRQMKDKLAHGKWLPWLYENCTDISERTAQNYMRIAKFSEGNPQMVADLKQCTSLQEAYLLTGIFKLPKTLLLDDDTSKDVREARSLAKHGPTASLTQGQLLLWIVPGSGSFLDSFGQYPVERRGEPIRFMKDLSGLGRHVWTPQGTMAAYMKYMYLTNLGEGNNKPALWVDGVNGCGLQSATVATPTYPLWLFVVARMPTGSVATTTVFDGIGSSNRFLCQVGTTIQIYSGTSMTGNVTGSLTGSIRDRWFLQSFKNTAGGNNSYVNTNGTQSVIGNCGGQSITGYTIASDYLGNNGGGGVLIAELILASNITDSDAAKIETYLKSKHNLFY